MTNHNRPLSSAGMPPSNRPLAWWEQPVPLQRELAAMLFFAQQRTALELIWTARYAEALPVLDGMLADDPTDKDVLLMKGVCLLNLGDYRTALAVLKARVDRLPSNLPLNGQSFPILGA